MAEINTSKKLKKALECLEENTLTSYVSRSRTYQSIGNILTTPNDIEPTTARRLLTVCIQDLKEDMKYAVNTLNIISLVLKKIKTKKNMSIPEVVQSAVAILGIIKTTALMCKVQALPTLCFDTFLSYPDETYVELVTDFREEIMELFSLYFLRSISVILQVMPFNVLLKILKILPPQKKKEFVENGVSLWFSHLVPTVMQLMGQNQVIPSALETLEIITESLQDVEYSGKQEWMALMENICTPDKYSNELKTLLENGNNNWYRLWNVFVRLLKEQLTSSKCKLGSPINSLLPVVEMAFKMDIANRVRAFHCWMVLTDNFSSESQEQYVSKRIKLLIIPLKSKNAKVEETALAKFDTWWHVIRKFHPRISKLIDIVYLPFLTFCFGNLKNARDKSVTAPGQFSARLRKLSVEAFIESVGHAGCDGCVGATFPRLSEPILNQKHFVAYFAEWLGAFTMVIATSAAGECGAGAGRMLGCVWKSFIMTADKCPDTDKHRLLDELLNFLSQKIEEYMSNEETLKIIMEGLIMSSFDKAVLNIIGQIVHRRDRLIHIAVDPLILYSRDSMLTPDTLKPLTDAIMDDTMSSSQAVVNAVMEHLTKTDAGLHLWARVMEAACDVDCDDATKLKRLLMWPIDNIEHFKNDLYLTSVWNVAYTKFWPQLQSAGIDNDISFVLLSKFKATSSMNLLATHALLQVLNKVLKKDSGSNYKMEAELLMTLLEKVDKLESIQTIVPVVLDSLLLMMNKALEGDDTFVVECALKAANSMMKVMNLVTGNSENDVSINKSCNDNMEKILPRIDEIFKNTSYIKFKSIVIDQIISCLNRYGKTSSIKSMACGILKKFLSKSDKTETPFYTMVENALNLSDKVIAEKPITIKDASFVTPTETKSTKKKQAKILNKVIENGEEFVVVKSNWKFNPKKMTEHQKERLQKKREDIPALYQDLSQSQDEFKMTAWKTDSQDNSSTNSKSASRGGEDFSDILKKMTSTEVVPKIMETMFLSEKTGNENGNAASEKRLAKVQTPSPKQGKSPRVALKDRVFQNVKNLIEKSTVGSEHQRQAEAIKPVSLEDNAKQDTLTISKEQNKNTIAAATTPSPKNLSKRRKSELRVTGVYSSSSEITEDRPSRVKRKPRKFLDEFEVGYTNKRRSLRDSQEKSDIDQYSQEVVKIRKSEVLLNEIVDKPKTEVTTVVTIHDEPKKRTCTQITSSEEPKNDQADSSKNVPIVFLEQTTPEKLQKLMASVAVHDDPKKCLSFKTNAPVKEQIINSKESDNQEIISPNKKPIVIEQTTPKKMLEKIKHDKNTGSTPSPTEKSEKTKSKNQSNKKAKIQRQHVIDMGKNMSETASKSNDAHIMETDNKINEVNKASANSSEICDDVDNNATQGNVLILAHKPNKVNSAKKQAQTSANFSEICDDVDNNATQENVSTLVPKPNKVNSVKKQAHTSANSSEIFDDVDNNATQGNVSILAHKPNKVNSAKKQAQTSANSSEICDDVDNNATQENVSTLVPKPNKVNSAKKQAHTSANSSEICDVVDNNVTKENVSTLVPKPNKVNSAKKQAHTSANSSEICDDVDNNATQGNVSILAHKPNKVNSAKKQAHTSANSSEICDVVDNNVTKENVSTLVPKPNKVNSAKKQAHTSANSSEICDDVDNNATQGNVSILAHKPNKVNSAKKQAQTSANSSEICEDVDNNATQENVSTLVPKPNKVNTAKKQAQRMSIIQKKLAIDTVEGHPLLSDSQSVKRITRKTVSSVRRKAMVEKIAKAHRKISKSNSKVVKKSEAPQSSIDAQGNVVKELFIANNTEDNSISSTDDVVFSEDFIESSQDSSSISVNSHNSMITKVKTVIEQNKSIDILTANQLTKDDIEFSQNKSIQQEIPKDITAELDTEPMDVNETIASNEVIVLTNDPEPFTVDTQESVSPDTQNTANADTQPMDTNKFTDDNIIEILTPTQETQDIPFALLEVVTDTPRTAEPGSHADVVSSPFRDEAERNKDFLNSTLEISPIRTMSPAVEKGSPESSQDYLVVRLSSPVQCNGEPFDKSASPEIFTDDKLGESEQSPPRGDVIVNAGSPSLSLKKNRPVVRAGGRGAQMLGLCVPDRLHTLVTERADTEESKKQGPSMTPARRSLRMQINCAEKEEAKVEEDSDTFLQLRKSLPPADCSPAGPILKRKLAKNNDDATESPASKRKRVSFHDPPVSTTVSVHKYIELIGPRSPQTSAGKKPERQTRPTVVKSSKKLETIFKLDTVLTKAVECFVDSNAEDTEMSSMEQTPAVEIVKTSELNDVDPICPQLMFCKDPISNIATELSSPAMKASLVKELEGRVDTIGDLAKLTELEVNRLRIKAPKVEVAKKVLADYANNLIDTLDDTSLGKTVDVVNTSMNCEVQTEAVERRHSYMQTDALDVSAVDPQTDRTFVEECAVQTNVSGSQSTKDVIETCLTERTNIDRELCETLQDFAKAKIASGLSVGAICSVIDPSSVKRKDCKRLLETAVGNTSNAQSLDYLQQYMVNRYNTGDIILFCSDLLRKLHGKSTEM